MTTFPGPEIVHVVVPARDEAATLEQHLDSVRAAADAVRTAHPEIAVDVTLVLDGCGDESAPIARRHTWVKVLEVDLGVVGAVRREGIAHATRSDVPGASAWIACTDADSVVAPDWLLSHVHLARRGVDLVVGTVRPDTEGLDGGLLARWQARHTLREGHPHVHGANLGFSLTAYTTVGGFAPLASGEDVALVEAMQDVGVRWAATARSPVVTSSRREGRAAGGFAAYLLGLVP